MEKYTFVSFDVETTGPVPGLHSMVSLGAVRGTVDSGRQAHFPLNASHAEFEAAIAPLEDAGWDEDTKAWWFHPERDAAREHVFGPIKAGRADQPEEAMLRLCAWLEKAREEGGAPLVFVAYPATFDFAFLNYYMHRFCPRRWKELHKGFPGFACFDMLTYASAELRVPVLEATRRNWPAAWKAPQHVAHTALRDAHDQGISFVEMLKGAW